MHIVRDLLRHLWLRSSLCASYHRNTHKHAAILAITHRFISIPLSKKVFQKEVSTIIVQSNNIRISVDICFVRSAFHVPLIERLLISATLPLKMDENSDLVNSLVSFAPPTPQATSLLSWKILSPPPRLERSGVYQLSCSDCPATYIGQTGRKLGIRV